MASFKYNTVEELLTPQERFALYEQKKTAKNAMKIKPKKI